MAIFLNTVFHFIMSRFFKKNPLRAPYNKSFSKNLMIRIVQIPDNIPKGFRDLPDEFIEAADEKVDHVEGEGSLRGYTLPATALVRVLPPELDQFNQYYY